MKKLALTLLCMAMSSALLATASTTNAGNNPAATTGKGATQARENTIAGQQQPSAINEADCPQNTASLALNNSNNCQDASATTHYNNPIRRKSSNRSYSLTDEVTYVMGVGLRAGAREGGITAKYFIDGNTAFEAILSTGWEYRGTRITTLYEVQRPIGHDGWYWYWGIGGHAGRYTEQYWNKGECFNGKYEMNGKFYDCNSTRNTLGIDGIVGFEYHFLDTPITFSIDAKPSVDIMGWGSKHYGDLGASLRYTF